MKNVLITGASGMVGSIVLQQCLNSKEVTKITSLVRRKSVINNPKLEEVLISDFNDYQGYESFFRDVDVAYFCIGVYTFQVDDAKFKVITVDYPVAFGMMLKEYSPEARILLLSGAGTDRKEKSRTPFARYKGMAENRLSEMFDNAHFLRPGYIYPVEKRQEPHWSYSLSRRLYPVLRLLGKSFSIKSTELGEAMFRVGMNGHDKEVLENRDIMRVLEERR